VKKTENERVVHKEPKEKNCHWLRAILGEFRMKCIRELIL